MEQRPPSALPLCPLCGGSDVVARLVMADGHERVVIYGCRTCAQDWEEARRQTHAMFDPLPTPSAFEP